jgi:DNA-binding NarL/FixJ family response regulator
MKLLVADDHPLVRDALARTLQAVLPQAQVFQAPDRAGAEALLQAEAPALALLDLHMPGMQGAAGVAALHRRFPAVRLLVVSGDDDPATVRAVLAAGAVGFLPKAESGEVMQQALRLVLQGGSYVPAQALAGLDSVPASPRASAGSLTPRQHEVLRCLMQGQPNKQIARELGIGEGTVKLHLAAVLRALHARNRTEAVVRARELGLGP